MDKIELKKRRYLRRRRRVKKKIQINLGRARLCIYKSNKNIYAQIIDDTKGHTIASASTLEKEFAEIKNRGNVNAARILGKMIAERALEKGIKNIVFDRNGYLYHGKVKALTDSAREYGIEF